MAQTLFSRCTRKLSRSVFIQMTHHQLVFYETTHGPLKQPNDIKTTRPTLIMNNRLCSLPGLFKMKETVIWFKKSYSCLYQICLWWSWEEGCCWPCMNSVCYVLHWFFQSSCLLYQGCVLYQGIEILHYSIRNSIIRNLMSINLAHAWFLNFQSVFSLIKFKKRKCQIRIKRGHNAFTLWVLVWGSVH